jgi:4-oxalocrotonate tautomerase
MAPEDQMPLIRATLMGGALTSDQKHELIRRLTDATLAVYGESMRPYCWVLVEEITSGQWGAGGQALTTADVRALMRSPAEANPTPAVVK